MDKVKGAEMKGKKGKVCLYIVRLYKVCPDEGIPVCNVKGCKGIGVGNGYCNIHQPKPSISEEAKCPVHGKEHKFNMLGNACGCGELKPKAPPQSDAGTEVTGNKELWDLIVNYFPAFEGEIGGQNKRALFEQVAKLMSEKEAEIAELKKRQKSGGDILFDDLCHRLIKRILSSADMNLPEATDIELSLARIIGERDNHKAEIGRLKKELSDMGRLMG